MYAMYRKIKKPRSHFLSRGFLSMEEELHVLHQRHVSMQCVCLCMNNIKQQRRYYIFCVIVRSIFEYIEA